MHAPMTSIVLFCGLLASIQYVHGMYSDSLCIAACDNLHISAYEKVCSSCVAFPPLTAKMCSHACHQTFLDENRFGIPLCNTIFRQNCKDVSSGVSGAFKSICGSCLQDPPCSADLTLECSSYNPSPYFRTICDAC